MAINRPMLPPKAGYVEIEVDGMRMYRNVETGAIYSPQNIPTSSVSELEQLRADLDFMAMEMGVDLL